jgi:selenocysteine-specific elongation factor
MRVIGTAGHVDHGKSTLIKRLTGIDPDRLAEEKAREMTIDLGFAWLTLPNGELVGIIDVPGHRDFINNMLAGIGGIDAVLMVIAADEGIMPQTAEHLAIVDLLGIEAGVVALTKIDQIDDPDWLALVEDEITAALVNTSLAGVPIVPVSSLTGEGLDVLVQTLMNVLANQPPKLDSGRARLPIDRVFTLSGFGTIVTGTLSGGTLRVGDEIHVLPGKLVGRIRGLQSYKTALQSAHPGSRVAVNITGIDRAALRRGQVLVHPHQWNTTLLADAHLRLLPESRTLKHNTAVRVFSGSAEVSGRVRLLSGDQLEPGSEGWVQLRLEEEIMLAAGDRFILRLPSPGQTIGGGIIVDAHPARRWRRNQPELLRMLERRFTGSPEERLAELANEPVKRSVLQQRFTGSPAEFEQIIASCLKSGLLIALPDDFYLATAAARALLARMESELRRYYDEHPLRLAMPREALRSRLDMKTSTFNALLKLQGHIVDDGTCVRLRGRSIEFTPAQKGRIRALEQKIKAAPYTPPSYAEAIALVGEEVLHALIDLGLIVKTAPEVIFARETYDEMVARVLALIDAHGAVTVGTLRDAFGASRKYAIALLEHLDAAGITARDGDQRIRGPNSVTLER